jgi:hypothetical protein
VLYLWEWGGRLLFSAGSPPRFGEIRRIIGPRGYDGAYTDAREDLEHEGMRTPATQTWHPDCDEITVLQILALIPKFACQQFCRWHMRLETEPPNIPRLLGAL